MIVFDLRCAAECGAFEVWFTSSEDYAAQKESGLVLCPYCGSDKIEKAPMAPRVARSDDSLGRDESPMASLLTLQANLLRNSEWVGADLPETARAMHVGEMEPRTVHGQASAEEARSLIDDGIPILPLPLPVVPPGQVN